MTIVDGDEGALERYVKPIGQRGCASCAWLQQGEKKRLSGESCSPEHWQHFGVLSVAPL